MRWIHMTALIGAFLLGGCRAQGADWVEDDFRSIYEATLGSLRGELGVDALVVDPRPRFLVEREGTFGMGDFSDFPEPLLAEALRGDSTVVTCRLGRTSDCEASGHVPRVSLSEIYPIGPRDAGLLATSVDVRSDPIRARGFAVRLRSTRNRWRVVSVEPRETWAAERVP